jgi:hypothetical protein
MNPTLSAADRWAALRLLLDRGEGFWYSHRNIREVEAAVAAVVNPSGVQSTWALLRARLLTDIPSRRLSFEQAAALLEGRLPAVPFIEYTGWIKIFIARLLEAEALACRTRAETEIERAETIDRATPREFLPPIL